MLPAKHDSYQVNEQFSGQSLNSDLWEAIMYPAGYRNHEEQDYTPSQVAVANGVLQITATRDAHGQWHSGEVHSKWHYTYGEFEVRMALSTTGPGVWPAAWLMGTTDPWPSNGELDIMENINGQSTVYGTIHGQGATGPWQLQKSYSGMDITRYHIYKLVKQPKGISWYIDGVKRGEWSQAQTPPGGIWPFESHSNFALLNLAIGGDWPGPSTPATPDRITMNVDYYTVKNAY
jgi:beta-glucanase (GH16 family)